MFLSPRHPCVIASGSVPGQADRRAGGAAPSTDQPAPRAGCREQLGQLGNPHPR